VPKIFIDRTPLQRYPEFKRLWLSQGVSAIGSQLAIVTLAVQIYRLTGSTIDVGLISLIQLLPAIFGSIVGGSIADAMDRRRLLVITGTLATISAAMLGINAMRHHPIIWVIYLLAAISAAIQSVDSPARTSLLMSIVDRELLVPANALRGVLGQFAQVVGPSIGGVLLAVLHVSIVYWINAASFLVVVGAMFTISAHEPKGGTTRFGMRSIAEGIRFLKGRQALQACFFADLNANILGMPTAVFPALAVVQFHGGSKTMGILYAAPGLGSVIGSAFSGWTLNIRRPGRAVLICITVWGLALAAFGLATSLVVAVIFLAIAGFADQVSAIFRGSIIQSEAPDRLRGRISAIQQASNQAGPRLGNGEAGLIAGISTPQISVISGGLASVVGIAVIALTMHKFSRYELQHLKSETVLDEAPQ
jgi:MFS family permease